MPIQLKKKWRMSVLCIHKSILDRLYIWRTDSSHCFVSAERRGNQSNTYYAQVELFNYFSSRLAVVFVQYIEARCLVKKQDVVGAAPTGDAPTTSEESTMLLSTKTRLILEIWGYRLLSGETLVINNDIWHWYIT